MNVAVIGMNIEVNFSMKSFRLLAFVPLVFMLAGCRFFGSYSKDNTWSYFEEWDLNTDMRIDKDEFLRGCVNDGFLKKSDGSSAADAMFATADENKDGKLTSLEFYRWKVAKVDATAP